MKEYFTEKTHPSTDRRNRTSMGNPHRVVYMDDQSIDRIFWGSRLKSTPSRRRVVTTLAQQPGPISAPAICDILCVKDTSDSESSEEKPEKPLTKSSVYRILEDLSTAGIINRVDFQHDHAHYEYAVGRMHHHHVICTLCDDTEEITSCAERDLETEIGMQLKKFAGVTSHTVEFFGVCKKCTVISKK